MKQIKSNGAANRTAITKTSNRTPATQKDKTVLIDLDGREAGARKRAAALGITLQDYLLKLIHLDKDTDFLRKSIQAKPDSKANGATGTEALSRESVIDSITQGYKGTLKMIDECRRLAEEGVDLSARCQEKGIRQRNLPRDVQCVIAEQKRDNATVKGEIEVPAWVYGFMCQAAAIHGLPDWRAALVAYLECTVTEWTNDEGFYLDGLSNAQ
jgi:hypothetical protein